MNEPEQNRSRTGAEPEQNRGAPRRGGRFGGVTARGGSSTPAPCTSHTGAAGAPCSGPTRPARPASPGASACVGKR